MNVLWCNVKNVKWFLIISYWSAKCDHTKSYITIICLPFFPVYNWGGNDVLQCVICVLANAFRVSTLDAQPLLVVLWSSLLQWLGYFFHFWLTVGHDVVFIMDETKQSASAERQDWSISAVGELLIDATFVHSLENMQLHEFPIFTSLYVCFSIHSCTEIIVLIFGVSDSKT